MCDITHHQQVREKAKGKKGDEVLVFNSLLRLIIYRYVEALSSDNGVFK